MFQHTESGQPVRDSKGNLLMRSVFIIDGINFDPFSFDKACETVNAKFHKNQKPGEIKSHHYILSFDPKDKTECGLTPERAQDLKTKKADLLTQKAMQEETLRAAVQRREELKTASYNVRWILSTDESRKQYRERGSIERNKKRRSVLTL